ncbi:hypothetical protein P171DRAFT_475505 [Karstenula rhodostoma CBS 690.94]|uniref:Uncharacterized protein n=1 Tax=Karstenula rhodostoma CBS 690.94 TaxID=1392251 RepID=A0A9P4P9U5_9PLEO|nr:hypothetical protein P171DRAFT_475505 [Karstenula rhodostoma CBS 690.94]
MAPLVTYTMPPDIDADPADEPMANTCEADTLETLRDWADEHICKQVSSRQVVSARPWQDNAIAKLPDFLSIYHHEGMMILVSNGYQWRFWSALATHTSNTMKTRVQEYRALGQSTNDMVVDVTSLKIPPYVLEEVIQFWCTKRLHMEYDKPKTIQPGILPSLGAPTDFSNAMTCLMSLVHLVDASYSLNDNVLTRTAFAALRTRVVDLQFKDSEFIEALDEVYSRSPDSEKVRILRKIFLAAALDNSKLFTAKGSLVRGAFLDLQLWNPDYQDHYNKGQGFRYRVRDWY